MSAVSSTVMTVDDFQRWVDRPENAGRYWELEQGRIIEMPPPSRLHGNTLVLLVRILSNYLFDQATGHMTTGDAGWIISRDPPIVRGPDVMLYMSQQSFDDIPKNSWSETPPDLIVEVFSPSDRPGRLMHRVRQYLDGGAKLVWVVYPEDKTLTAYVRHEFPRIYDDSDRLSDIAVLPGFNVPVSEFFRNPGEK